MWWRKKSLRERLIEGRDKLRRQIEILSVGPVGKGGSVNADQSITQLRAVLADIEDQLANLES